MIADYLNRGVVLDELQQILAQAGQMDEADRHVTVEALSSAAAREDNTSSGPRSYPPPRSERRGPGTTAAPLDDFAFISSDPVISLLQSALDEHAEKKQPAEVAQAAPADDQRRGPNDVTVVSDRRLKNAPEPRRTPDGRRLFDKFSITDVRWVGSKVAEGIRLFRGKHEFNDKPAPVCETADRVRLVVVGDWASGLPRAQNVAKQMRKVVEEGLNSGVKQHVIHLGDVYYSGWGREYEEHMLPYWPVKNEEADRIPSWTLNGNHDMYSGGHGYYNVALADPRFERQAKSSFFSIVNKHWKILGLDTSYEDAKLCDPQPAWLESEIVGESRKVMLLSHHQMFSAYEGVSKDIVDKVAPILARRPVEAWLWGHEHRCMIYKEHANVKNGRCIGHGGVPVYQSHKENDTYPDPGSYEYRAFYQKGLEKWALFGFAVLDFDNADVKIRYVDENGLEHKNESF